MQPIPKVALAFFTVAPIYVLIGMIWGSVMGATGDHLMAPAHAHLNLLGFVVMSIAATFYTLANGRYSNRLAWAHFWVANAALVVMIPTLAVILTGNTTPPVTTTIMIGEAATIAGMVLFLISVLGVWKRQSA